MTVNTLLAKVTLTAAILAACGMPTNANAAPRAHASSTSSTGSSISSARLNAKFEIINSSLALLSGDEQTMRIALQNPLEFISKPNDQEFTRELIAHAKAGKAVTGQARLSPAIVKSSAFVDEYVVTVPKGLSEGEMAAMLMATGDYIFVEPNWKLFPLATVPNDSQFGSSWQHTRIQSTAAWDLHTGTNDVTVAVCDSGVDLDHPDLQAALVSGYNAVDNQAQADGGQVADVNGHGSFVSGCAAAQGNNGTGVVGVGWDFNIMPIRVSNNSSGTANGFDLLEGARWAVDNGAQAINVSFSGGSSSGNQPTANYVIENGGLLFWASGNDNAFVSFDALDLVLVGSTTSSDNRSGFSNFGTAVDLVAPGSSVRSTNRFGGYNNSSGTSFASPIAAGVAAMIFSARPDLSGRDVQDVLYKSVDDLGAAGRDDFFGRGRVNTFNAVQIAQAYTARIPLPISESFESAAWTDLFNTTSGSVSTVVDTESTGSGSVLVLNSNDQVTSVPIAGRTILQTTQLSYMFKTSGIEAGESFSIEIHNEDDSWTTLLDYTSTGVDTDGYIPVSLELPIEFRQHQAAVRITADGSDASDQWLIDDLFVGELTTVPVAPFVDSFESGAVSTIWTTNSGVTVDVAGSTHAAVMLGDVRITSQTIPMVQFGFVPASVSFDIWSDGNTSADDSVLVEIRDIIGNWVTVGTVAGDALSTSPSPASFVIPVTAWAIDTLQIRLTSTGNDPIFIDNVFVGPDDVNPMCSDADFAEPYGQLNFFDVSAFLTAFGNQDPAADMDASGSFNFIDVSSFLTLYGQGCP